MAEAAGIPALKGGEDVKYGIRGTYITRQSQPFRQQAPKPHRPLSITERGLRHPQQSTKQNSVHEPAKRFAQRTQPCAHEYTLLLKLRLARKQIQ